MLILSYNLSKFRRGEWCNGDAIDLYSKSASFRFLSLTLFILIEIICGIPQSLQAEAKIIYLITAASFQIISNTPFICHSFIRRYITVIPNAS